MKLKKEKILSLENIYLKKELLVKEVGIIQSKIDSLGSDWDNELKACIGDKDIKDIENLDFSTGIIKFKEEENG